MIHVPIGHHRVVELTQRVAKQECCEDCKQEFVYIAIRPAVGSASSLFDLFDKTADALATARARELLDRIVAEPDLVACPACGWYQSHMVRHFQRRGVRFGISISLGVAASFFVIAVLILVQSDADLAITIGIAATLAAIAICIGLTLTFRWKSSSDPNLSVTQSDLQARIASTPAQSLAQYRASSAAPATVAFAPSAGASAAAAEDFSFDFLDAPLESLRASTPKLQLRKQQAVYTALAEAQRAKVRASITAIAVGSVVGLLLNSMVQERNGEVFFGLAFLAGIIGPTEALLTDVFLAKNFQSWISSTNIFNLGLPTKKAAALPRSLAWLGRAACAFAMVLMPMIATEVDTNPPMACLSIITCEFVVLIVGRQWQLRRQSKRRRGNR